MRLLAIALCLAPSLLWLVTSQSDPPSPFAPSLLSFASALRSNQSATISSIFSANKIPIGIIFSKQSHNEFLHASFRYAINYVNNKLNLSSTNYVRLVPVVSLVDFDDSFLVVHELCLQLNRGIMALVMPPSGFENSFKAIMSYATVYKLPVIFTSIHYEQLITTGTTGNVPLSPPLSYHYFNYTFLLNSDFTPAVADVIRHYKWPHFIYLYDSDNGFLKLQYLLQYIWANGTMERFPLQTVRRFVTAGDANSILRHIEHNSTMSFKYVLLECNPLLARSIIVNHVRDIYISNRNYHFVIANVVMSDFYLVDYLHELSAINITTLRVERSAKAEMKQFVNFVRYYAANYNRGGGSKLQQKQSEPNSSTWLNSTILSSDGVLLFDAVKVLSRTLSTVLPNKDRTSRGSSQWRHSDTALATCGPDHHFPVTDFADSIRNELLSTQFEGLTGPIVFDENRYRRNFSVDMMEITVYSKPSKIAAWSREDGLRLVPGKYSRVEVSQASEDIENKTYYVTSILEDPYLILKPDAGEGESVGNSRFEGYSKDLADLIALHMNISYELHLVKDSKYGAIDANNSVEWNGMVGELIRHEADIAIAPLTITSARERVIDFTKPFMSLGISIMIKKPQKKNPGIFSFMNPLSSEIWMCVILSYVGVSVVLYLVSRFSPYEWRYEETVYGPHVSNDFSLYNSLWFSLGAIMQQGCDVYPRSVAGRIVGSVWWFFTLILLSTYTANLAAFLTVKAFHKTVCLLKYRPKQVERMVAPINSADDLAKQTEVEYGVLRDSSSMEFFRRSKIAVHQRMWEFMSTRQNVFVNSYKEGIRRVRESKGKYAFLIESTQNDYENERMPCDTLKVGRNLDAKGYGVATPLGSPIREKLNLVVLYLKENGDLTRLENRWWYDRSECKTRDSQKDTSQNALTLNNVAGCFYILIGGLLLAMLVALFEFVLKARHDSIRYNLSIFESMRSIVNISITGRPTKTVRNLQLKSNNDYQFDEQQDNQFDYR